MVRWNTRSAPPPPLLYLLAALTLPAPEAPAQTPGDLVLALADVDSVARASSPRLQVLARQVEAVDADRRRALAWSDPALAYDHEQATGYREWQLTLHKRLERPFGRGDLRAAWEGRVRAAELQARQDARDAVADLQAGYVEIQLLASRIGRLERLADLVAMAADVAASRHAVGELSGLERRLIRLAAYTVEAAVLRTRLDHGARLAAWRAEMGLASGRGLRLVTPVTFRPADLDSIGAPDDRLRSAPGDQAQVALAQALADQAAAAASGLVPGLDVYGGYRRFSADGDGFVAGVALDLPLFGQDDAEAGRLRAEQRVVASELAADRRSRAGDAAARVAAVRALQRHLAAFAGAGEPEAAGDALLVSYREGAISLDDLLGAIQIEVAALEAHHADLATYYRNLFRLEALTGTTLVRLAPTE